MGTVFGCLHINQYTHNSRAQRPLKTSKRYTDSAISLRMKILMLVTMVAFVMAGLPTHAEGRDCDNCVGCFIRGNCHKYTPTSNGPRNAKDCQKAGGTDCKDGYGRPITNSNEMPSTTSAFTYPYDVTVSRRVNEGFGFVIFENHASRTGPTIGRIIAGSPAERCGRLHLGDRILAVNHVDIAGMHRGDIENLIKDFGYSVVLTVGGPIDECKTVEGPSAGSKCKFPFIFESQRYDKCTKVGEIGTFGCATEIDDSGEMIPEKWGICAYYCDIYEPVDCVWGDYGKWSACSKSCGGGEKTRSRAKATEKVNGGHECLGEATQTESCNEDACPDSNWIIGNKNESCESVCAKTERVCNSDEQSKITTEDLFEDAMKKAGHRSCQKFIHRDYSGVPLIADNGKTCVYLTSGAKSVCHDVKFAPHRPLCYCETTTTTTTISTMTTTAASTTTGSESGFKGCLSGFNLLVPKTIGEFAACVDENLKKLFGIVAVDCVWDEWEIGKCSKSCGGGNRTNVRIPKVEAKHGGEECQGESETTEECNTLQCPECTSDTHCTSTSKPACYNQKCLECTSHEHCTSSPKNYCVSHKCFEKPCDSRPCRNGGTCTNTYGEIGYSCHCPILRTGLNCEKKYDPSEDWY